jgi:hypothetical protein
MAETKKGLPFVASLSAIAALLLTVMIAVACQSPLASSGTSAGGKSDLELSFQVLGVTAPAKAGPSKSVSRLILSSAATLTVSLTPLDSGLSTPAPQTVPISSSSAAQVVSASFSGVEYGKYSIKAAASDSSNNPQFQQSSAIDVSASTMAFTLNLVPVINPSYPTYNSVGNYFDSIDIPPGATVGFEIPPEALTSGTYYLRFSMDTSVGVNFYAQDADGTLLASGVTDSIGYITTASTYVLPITPSSSSSPSYLTLYNPDTAYTSTSIGVSLYFIGT